MQKLDVKLDKKTVGVVLQGDLLKQSKGITLIALIVTIIVMLILVGVTITVALNGGLFNKAEEAESKTKIAQIQEALAIKKAEILADKNGKTPIDYEITISSLDIPAELKTEYVSKLKISPEGNLYYDASIVTNKEEQNQFKSMGINEYVIVNIWQERGLTVSIHYDSIYYGTGELIKEGLSIDAMTLKIDSQGGFSITELNWNFTASDINNMVEEGNCVISSDSIVLYDEILFKISNNGNEIIVGDSRRRIGKL